MTQRINISALHRHVNDHNDETTHEIVRVQNIGHQYFARTNMARTTARWNTETPTECRCDITRMSHRKTTRPEPYDFYLISWHVRIHSCFGQCCKNQSFCNRIAFLLRERCCWKCIGKFCQNRGCKCLPRISFW
jgi:hypothetical protein